MADSSERTPSAEFSYHTTPSNTPAYTDTADQATTAPAEATTLPVDTSSLPLEVADPLQAAAAAAAAPESGDETPAEADATEAPTPPDPSDMRSDIFADISEEQSRATNYAPPHDAFNLSLDPDYDLDLDLKVDYKYVTYADDGSDTVVAKKSESFDFVLEVDQDEVEEEPEASEESEPSVLDRYPYFAKLMDALVEYGTGKRLNSFLHKKMAEYFKKRNMDHVLVEVQHPEEALIKYGRKLDNFAALKEVDAVQRKELTGELVRLRDTRAQQCELVQERFQATLEREKAVGAGLINSKTGKEISEKLVKRLVRTQAAKAQELRALRLMHITIRNAVAAKNAAIRDIDKIGDNYTLIEFEQMKMENQTNLEKVEDRDEELTRLRKRCQNAIQALAHMREKCSASEQSIRLLREALEVRKADKTAVREEMNRLKQERDLCRLETLRLKEENGLLTKDQLLIDMEHSINRIAALERINERKGGDLARQQARLKHLKVHHDNELRRQLNAARLRTQAAPPAAAPADEEEPKVRRGPRAPNKYMGDRPSDIRRCRRQ